MLDSQYCNYLISHVQRNFVVETTWWHGGAPSCWNQYSFSKFYRISGRQLYFLRGKWKSTFKMQRKVYPLTSKCCYLLNKIQINLQNAPQSISTNAKGLRVDKPAHFSSRQHYLTASTSSLERLGYWSSKFYTKRRIDCQRIFPVIIYSMFIVTISSRWFAIKWYITKL